MALSPGTKLGPYEIQAPLGAGGMGEVYRARDTRLGRDVAIKVLPPELASNTERRQRLEREARAVSALNHPNICTLHDIGHYSGIDYLVMEYVEGETLEKRLDRGPLPVPQVSRVGAEIAEALAKAHRQGILHRDLKPANIMLATSGAKLLDFGLAKPSGAGALKLTATQTLSSGDGVLSRPLTAEGAIVGTLQYMAPEQLEGKEADARTDVFALGAVLYEMATGRKAFTAKSQASMVAAILEHEPEPLSRVQPLTPPALERAVQRCLAKDPDERWQSAADLASELRWIASTGASGIMPVVALPSRRALRWLPWALAAMAVIAVVVWVFRLVAGSAPPMRQQFAILMPGEVSHLALSPDGRYLAFVSPDDISGTNLVFVQDVGGSASRPLAGTEGASYPFWSPDDKYVGFFANGKLKKVPVAGGPPEALADAGGGRGGTWGRRDIILYTPQSGGGIWRINADGSGNTRAGDRMEPGEVSHRWPMFLPDGEHYLYWRGSFSERPDAKRGIYLGSLDNGSVHLVTTARSSMGYGDGMLFYVDERGSLVFAPLDISKAKLTREPRLVSSTVGFSPSTYWGAFTVAENGTVVLNSSLGAALSQLTWYDRNGKELDRVGDAAIQANPSISSDGTRVAMDANDAKARNIDVWVENLKSGTMTRFTFDPAEETTPVWSRDGKTIAYRMGNPEGGALQVKKATGLESERTIQHARGGGEFLPNSWSDDGSQILCTYISTQGEPKLVLVSTRDGKPTPFAAGDRGASNGQISPNGKWVAFASNESGDWEIYVTTFPGAAGKWQVSRGGGTEPRWSANGKEIYYVGSNGMLTAVPIDEAGAFTTGVPHPLFRIHSRAPISSTDLFTYDVSFDGQRFLVNRYVKPDLIPPLTIVLHATSR